MVPGHEVPAIVGKSYPEVCTTLLEARRRILYVGMNGCAGVTVSGVFNVVRHIGVLSTHSTLHQADFQRREGCEGVTIALSGVQMPAGRGKGGNLIKPTCRPGPQENSTSPKRADAPNPRVALSHSHCNEQLVFNKQQQGSEKQQRKPQQQQQQQHPPLTPA